MLVDEYLQGKQNANCGCVVFSRVVDQTFCSQKGHCGK